MGQSEYPLLRYLQIKGLAVGRCKRYRCEYIGYVQGCYGETLVNVRKPLVHLWNLIPCHPPFDLHGTHHSVLISTNEEVPLRGSSFKPNCLVNPTS